MTQNEQRYITQNESQKNSIHIHSSRFEIIFICHKWQMVMKLNVYSLLSVFKVYCKKN